MVWLFLDRFVACIVGNEDFDQLVKIVYAHRGNTMNYFCVVSWKVEANILWNMISFFSPSMLTDAISILICMMCATGFFIPLWVGNFGGKLGFETLVQCSQKRVMLIIYHIQLLYHSGDIPFLGPWASWTYSPPFFLSSHPIHYLNYHIRVHMVVVE